MLERLLADSSYYIFVSKPLSVAATEMYLVKRTEHNVLHATSLW